MSIELDGMSTTLSDRELTRIGDRCVTQPYDFSQHGFSAEQVAHALAREALQLRRAVRAFIEADPKTPLAVEVDRYLGFNVTPEQL